MVHYLRLFFLYLRISIRSQMQYQASFMMMSLANFLATGSEFIAIWALFHRFGALRGWRMAEIAIFYSIVHISFSLAESFGRGFSRFSLLIKSGDFDRLLLRPMSTAFQVAARELHLTRIGRFSQGLVILLWSATVLEVDWNLARITLLIGTILAGAGMFYGIFILQATLAFWSTETLELFNTITYGGTETGQYPMAIYQKRFRQFFTFIVPLACVNYYPALAIMAKPDPLNSPVWFHWLSPLIGFIFLFSALQIWKIGVRKYQSAGG